MSTPSRCRTAVTRSGASPHCAGFAGCMTAPPRRPATLTSTSPSAPGSRRRSSGAVTSGWARAAVPVSGHHASLGKDAVLRHVAVTLGGDLVRLTARARFCAPGGDAELLGLYFADDGQHFESRLLVDHAQPNCRSHVTYRGALQGDPESKKPDAHTVWVGDVLIRAEATGTDTFETNRNLVLTDGARSDSVPNLEIETRER